MLDMAGHQLQPGCAINWGGRQGLFDLSTRLCLWHPDHDTHLHEGAAGERVVRKTPSVFDGDDVRSWLYAAFARIDKFSNVRSSHPLTHLTYPPTPSARRQVHSG
jgi:hypothetical protein